MLNPQKREKKKPPKQRGWCPYTGVVDSAVSYSPYERMRVRCPHCKRRMIAKVDVCSIGCCITFVIPKHKSLLKVENAQ